MCKKQIAVSHSSAESEILSLDAGLSVGGVPSSTIAGLLVRNIFRILMLWKTLRAQLASVIVFLFLLVDHGPSNIPEGSFVSPVIYL